MENDNKNSDQLPTISMGSSEEDKKVVPPIDEKKHKSSHSTEKKITPPKYEPPKNNSSNGNPSQNTGGSDLEGASCLLVMVVGLIFPIICGIGACSEGGVGGFFGGLIVGIILEAIALFLYNLFH